MPITGNILGEIIRGWEALTGPSPAPAPKPKPKVPTKPKGPTGGTKKERIAATAKRVAKEKQAKTGDFATAWNAGIRRGLFGIPERLSAAGAYFTQDGDVPYSDILDLQRAITDEELNLSTGGNIIGQIMSGAGAGRAAYGLISKGAGGLAAAGLPGAEKARNALQSLVTFNRGAKAKNAAKLATLGGAAGGAQAVGEGSDPLVGTATGAVAAPALAGAGKTLGFLGRPLVDMVSSSNFGQILRRFTNTTMEDLQKARTAYKQKTGAEPTIAELLPKEDLDAIGRLVIRNSPNLQEQTATAMQGRAASVGPEMQAVVEKATGPRVQAIQRGMADELAVSREGAQPSPEEIELAIKASRSQIGQKQLREQEARNIMAPFDERQAYASVEELQPREDFNPLTNEVTPADPEAAAQIAAKAQGLRLSDRGITIKQITNIRRALKKEVDAGNVNSDAALRAVNHLDDLLARDHPDAAEAIQKMRDQFAGRKRTTEGFVEGKKTRLADDYSGKELTGENIYETPEGKIGRTLGQTRKLQKSFGGTPRTALSQSERLASDPDMQRAVAENISPRAALQMTEAARAQSEGMNRIASILGKTRGEATGDDAQALSDAFLLLNPGSFVMTKAAAFARLQKMSRIGEKKASYLVDRLFSQDPKKIEEGLKLFDRMGGPGRQALKEISQSVIVNASRMIPNDGSGEEVPSDFSAEADPYAGMTDEELDAEYQRQLAGESELSSDDPYAGMTDEELDAEYQRQLSLPYGRSVIESVFPEAEITEDMRDPGSKLGRANPDSHHNKTDGAVDVRPIPGMTFDEFIDRLESEGYTIIEAIDEVNNPSGHATGPHWHVVFG